MRGDELDDRGSYERCAPEDELERDAAERVDVGAVIDVARSANLLRCHVHRRADEHASLRLRDVLVVRGEFDDAEIEQLGSRRRAATALEKDVLRLEVAVDYAGLVRGFEPARDLFDDVERLVQRYPTARETIAQRLADQVLHHEVGAAVGELAEPKHVHDVRTRELRDHPRFTPETRNCDGVARHVLANDLDRDALPEHAVDGGEYRAHAALAYLALDLVVADERALRKVDEPSGAGDGRRQSGVALLCAAVVIT
ncbi:MAG TPA: hypothetical protein VGL61_31415 [Kofleriaceae bacterium]